MKIGQVAPLMESVPPRLYGGTERIVSYLTEELVRMGHEVCRPLVSQNAIRRDNAPRQAALVGGRNGEAFGPFHCPGLLPVTGMHGQSGRYVDQLQLFCGR